MITTVKISTPNIAPPVNNSRRTFILECLAAAILPTSGCESPPASDEEIRELFRNRVYRELDTKSIQTASKQIAEVINDHSAFERLSNDSEYGWAKVVVLLFLEHEGKEANKGKRSSTRSKKTKSFAKTIKSHWSGIVNYSSSKLTNALLESTNAKIQEIKRRVKGFRHIQNFVMGDLDFHFPLKS